MQLTAQGGSRAVHFNCCVTTSISNRKVSLSHMVSKSLLGLSFSSLISLSYHIKNKYWSLNPFKATYKHNKRKQNLQNNCLKSVPQQVASRQSPVQTGSFSVVAVVVYQGPASPQKEVPQFRSNHQESRLICPHLIHLWEWWEGSRQRSQELGRISQWKTALQTGWSLRWAIKPYRAL